MSRKNNGAPQEVEVAIAGLSNEGLGEGMLNDRPILVRNALPGETVTARILRKRKGFRFADGITPDLADAHEHRIAPACGNFPRCGGCAMHRGNAGAAGVVWSAAPGASGQRQAFGSEIRR